MASVGSEAIFTPSGSGHLATSNESVVPPLPSSRPRPDPRRRPRRRPAGAYWVELEVATSTTVRATRSSGRRGVRRCRRPFPKNEPQWEALVVPVAAPADTDPAAAAVRAMIGTRATRATAHPLTDRRRDRGRPVKKLRCAFICPPLVSFSSRQDGPVDPVVKKSWPTVPVPGRQGTFSTAGTACEGRKGHPAAGSPLRAAPRSPHPRPPLFPSTAGATPVLHHGEMDPRTRDGQVRRVRAGGP